MTNFKGVFLKLLATVLVVTAFLPSSWAQNTRQVKGTIYDETGEPFPGVVVLNRKLKLVATTDADGKFLLERVPVNAVLTVEMMSYKSQEIIVADVKKEVKIYLEPDSQVLEESVVTGIFTRRKDSFTGSVQSMTSDDIKRVSNSNVVESLKNLDPSLMILDNLEAGSNPNAMASMQIRGASTLAAETSGLKSNFLAKANQPLFILDGFETTLEKVTDMDMNLIQSITILKDASAKAIYGSKGANGVIVIETKSLTNDKTRVTYNGSLTIEAPDLTSYNLCNSLEKLDVEQREGYYNSSDSFETIARRLRPEAFRQHRAGLQRVEGPCHLLIQRHPGSHERLLPRGYLRQCQLILPPGRVDLPEHHEHFLHEQFRIALGQLQRLCGPQSLPDAV